MRNRYGYYGHLSSMSKVPCPYQPKKKVVSYYDGPTWTRRIFPTEEEAAAFKDSLPASAKTQHHSN